MNVFTVITKVESKRPTGYAWITNKREATHTVNWMMCLNFTIESYARVFFDGSSSQSPKHLSRTADRAVGENVLTVRNSCAIGSLLLKRTWNATELWPTKNYASRTDIRIVSIMHQWADKIGSFP